MSVNYDGKGEARPFKRVFSEAVKIQTSLAGRQAVNLSDDGRLQEIR